VIGSAILLRGEPYTVVGVMPPSVRHPTPETAVWVPHSLVGPNMFSNGMPTRGDRYLRRRPARVRAGRGAGAAGADRAVGRARRDAIPESNADWTRAAVVPLHTSIVGDVDQALLVVLASSVSSC
jgi:hypothetical protein